MEPLVSIGIPTFNNPDSLKKTLQSLCDQSYKHLEIIVSDNCSPGVKTRQIVLMFQKQDKRISYFRQKKNIGPSKNFMFVLQQAHGEYYMWLADDDRIDIHYIEQCINYMIEHPEYTLVGGLAKYYAREKFIQTDIVLNLCQDNPIDRVKQYYRIVIYNGIFYGLYRRDHMTIDLKDYLASDWTYISDIAFKGKICTLPGVHIHRQRNIQEKTAADLVKRLKLKGMAKIFPHLSQAINVFCNILFSKTYTAFGSVQKIKLAFICFFILYYRYAIVQFYYHKIHPYTEKVFDSFPKLHMVLKKMKGHVTKQRSDPF